jgi:hypothetical protein
LIVPLCLCSSNLRRKTLPAPQGLALPPQRSPGRIWNFKRHAYSACSGDLRAREAVELFVFRVVREIGALTTSMGGIDGLVFTAGIGEYASEIRSRVCARCERFRFLQVRAALVIANLRLYFLSNTANIGPSDKRLPWRLSDGAYKLGALPPSRNRALGQFSPSRNRRAKASNDTSP